MSGRRIQEALTRLSARILDPGLCTGCGHHLKPLQFFCPCCRSKFKLVGQPCSLCGLENKTTEPICAACLYDPPRWQNMIAPLIYHSFSRNLLIQLKFNQRLHLANTLASTLIEHYRHGKSTPDVLLPVPLHHRRLRERGYNQAFEIARILSRLLQIPIDTRSLQRIRHTDSQSGLSAAKRERNILGAFAYTPAVDYQHVAIVDDIVTTGSTANEITKTLHQGGVFNVEIWGLARVLIRA